MNQVNAFYALCPDVRHVFPESQPINATPLPRGWGRPVAKCCLWILRHLGVKHLLPAVRHIEYLELDLSKLDEDICKMRLEVMRAHGRDLRYLVVGRDEFERLFHHALSQPWVVPYEMTLRYSDGRFEYLGFTVVCVPWLKGMALLPDLEKFCR